MQMWMTNEERELVYRFIYLPLVRKVLERDMIKIKQAGLKFTEPYVEFMEAKIIQVGKEIRDIKKAMRKTGVTVYENGTEIVGENMTTSVYLAIFRGYREEIGLPTHVIKSNVLEYMREYIK